MLEIKEMLAELKWNTEIKNYLKKQQKTKLNKTTKKLDKITKTLPKIQLKMDHVQIKTTIKYKKTAARYAFILCA